MARARRDSNESFDSDSVPFVIFPVAFPPKRVLAVHNGIEVVRLATAGDDGPF